MNLIPYNKAAEVLPPGKKPFHFPAPAIAPQCPPILSLATIAPVGGDHLYPPILFQLGIELVTVVGFVADEPLGQFVGIPAAKMKMRQVHIVPLSSQVIDILEDLRQYTGQGRYLFPGVKTKSEPISEMTLSTALRRMGYGKEQMTVHGFRSMASTLLNEQGYNRDWIERQLAHGERNSIRAAYNYAEYLHERRRMIQEWADYLDTLRENKK